MKRWFALALALVLAFGLTGCGVMDFMYYLFDTEDIMASHKAEPDYVTVTAPNGVVITYDQNAWGEPVVEDDAADTAVMSTTGSGLNQTVVMVQKGGDYTDFIEQSAGELKEIGGTVEKEIEISVEGAKVTSARYDCGSYQTILAQLDFEEGSLYVTAATKSANPQPVIDLIEGIAWGE